MFLVICVHGIDKGFFDGGVCLQRLIKCGLPPKYLERGQAGVALYVKEHRLQLPAVVAALLPGVDDIPPDKPGGADQDQQPGLGKEFQNQCRDALKWVQWAMFQGEPQAVLADAGQQNGGARGVCGAVWGSHYIAYQCRTCELDPTCAICVPCFQHGNHSTHDYSMIRTGGGCCDCGDITAWKQSGFCSRHCGPGRAASLSPSVVATATPVLEAILSCWRLQLLAADLVVEGKPKKWSLQTKEEKLASQLSVACIDMLLDFCKCSESMLAFTAEVVGKKSVGILDILMRTEYFLPKALVTSLHELLYKLLGDGNFKHAFAEIFISYYPKFLHDLVSEETARACENAPTLYSFSVQIFTVPTLTLKLVMESGLLDMLLETLQEFFCSCIGEDGRLRVYYLQVVHAWLSSLCIHCCSAFE
jgi:E3 ubiquitin-protein ligase UBR3